jgi:hypothetical protein
MELYAYSTFTAPSAEGLPRSMKAFVDRLQRIAEALPLRLVPLEIVEYGPVTPRLRDQQRKSMDVQQAAIVAWQREIERRFTTAERQTPINDIDLVRTSR